MYYAVIKYLCIYKIILKNFSTTKHLKYITSHIIVMYSLVYYYLMVVLDSQIMEHLFLKDKEVLCIPSLSMYTYTYWGLGWFLLDFSSLLVWIYAIKHIEII